MITVTGSLAFDHIMDFPGKFSDHIMPDKIHQINLSFLVNKLSKQKGGTAGNIAYNLALLGSPVSIVGTAGSDFSEYSKFLQDTGVDVSGIKIVDDSTSSAYIMTDQADNQITAFYPGAMSQNSSLTLSPSRSSPRFTGEAGQSPPGSHLDSRPHRVQDPGRWSKGFVVISPNDPKAMINFTKQCQEKNIPYMLDPGMQLPALDAQDLKNMINGAAILIGNDYEMALLCDKTQVTSDKLLEQVKILITTLGEKGSTIQSGTDTIQIEPGKPNEVVDPTGAGDAYRAGFLAGYTKGLDLKICGQMGSVAAVFAIEKYGTTSHKFTIQEFSERYKESFGEELQP